MSLAAFTRDPAAPAEHSGRSERPSGWRGALGDPDRTGAMAEARIESIGTPEKIVGVISKLLTDLVARNDQVGRAPRAHAHPAAPWPLVAPRWLLAAPNSEITHHARRLRKKQSKCTSHAAHARSRQLPLAPTQVTPFHSSKPPTICVKSYLEDRCGPGPIRPPPATPHRTRILLRVRPPDGFSSARCRILKYAGCSEETFILALIYMDQVRTPPARATVPGRYSEDTPY